MFRSVALKHNQFLEGEMKFLHLPAVCVLMTVGISAEAQASCLTPPVDYNCYPLENYGDDPDIDASCPTGVLDSDDAIADYGIPSVKQSEVQLALADGRAVWIEMEMYGSLSVSSSIGETAGAAYELTLHESSSATPQYYGQSEQFTSNTTAPQSQSLYNAICTDISSSADSTTLSLTTEMLVEAVCGAPTPGSASAYLQVLQPPEICIESE